MTDSELLDTVCNALQRTLGTEAVPAPLPPSCVPLESIKGFDSLGAVEVEAVVEEMLHIELKGRTLFWAGANHSPCSLSHAVSVLRELVPNQPTGVT